MCAALVAALLFGSLFLGLAITRRRRVYEEPDIDRWPFEAETRRRRVRPNRAELLRHAKRLRNTSRAPRPRIERRLMMETRT
jgi:hypothetical protein